MDAIETIISGNPDLTKTAVKEYLIAYHCPSEHGLEEKGCLNSLRSSCKKCWEDAIEAAENPQPDADDEAAATFQQLEEARQYVPTLKEPTAEDPGVSHE